MNCYFANNCAIHARSDVTNQTITTATAAAVAPEPKAEATEATEASLS